jgi:dTMP kinase
MRGCFITLEGIEGVGKSTNLEYVSNLVREAGHDVVMTREPGGTELAERIRDLVLMHSEERVPPAAELLLMFAARAVHLENKILPALADGQWVICDRFTDASYAYQGGGRGADKRFIARLEQDVQGDLRPDLTLLLDADPAIGMKRARERGEVDRFETERNNFFSNVRELYLERARSDPDRIKVIDAAASLDEVRKAIRDEMKSVL